MKRSIGTIAITLTIISIPACALLYALVLAFGPKQVSETEAVHTECVELARLYCPANEQTEAIAACVRGVDLGIESFGNCEVER